MPRLRPTTLAIALLSANLAACSILPEPAIPDEPETTPLPPPRPRFGHLRPDAPDRPGDNAGAHRFPLRPRSIPLRPGLGLRPTFHAAVRVAPTVSPRLIEPPPPRTTAPPPAQGGWGAPIPGSIPVAPSGWAPLRPRALPADADPPLP